MKMYEKITEKNIDSLIEESLDILSDITCTCLNVISNTAVISYKCRKDSIKLMIFVSSDDPTLILHYKTNVLKKEAISPKNYFSSLSKNLNDDILTNFKDDWILLGKEPSDSMALTEHFNSLDSFFNSKRKNIENFGYGLLDDIFSIILNILQHTAGISSQINESFLLCDIRTSDKAPTLTLVYSNTYLQFQEFQNTRHVVEKTVSTESSPPCNVNNFTNAFLQSSVLDNSTKDVQKKSGKGYQCRYCALTFGYKSYLHRHEARHAGTESFSCNICGECFSELNTRDKHERTHEKPFKCQYCEKHFHKKSNRDIHETIHNGEKPFKCRLCKKAFKSQRYLRNHQSTHNEERPFKCHLCRISCKSLERLRCHQMIHTNERPFQCDVCKKTFTDERYLKQHQKTHNEKNFKCSHCVKKFSDMAKKEKHEETHFEQQPYKCLYCEETFSFVHAKERHQKKFHTGEKFYQCRYCEETFHFRGYLRHHEKTHMSPFKCSLCAKRFPTNSLKETHEKRHMKMQEQEKTMKVRYKCSYCKTVLATEDSFKIHEFTHTGVWPFVCKHCDLLFSTTLGFQQHELACSK